MRSNRAMRSIIVLLLVGMTGCSSTRFNFLVKDNDAVNANVAGRPDPAKVPSVAELVDYLNNNAGRVTTIQATSLDVTCTQAGKRLPNLHGKMVVEKPYGFRMGLDGPLGFAQVADLGSNREEFWFWIKAAPGQTQTPYQYYCSYKDLEKGVPFMPIPFQPQWIMEALGLGPYGPPERYRLEHDEQTLRLVEDSISPQGRAVYKIIVMKRRATRAPEPQVTHYLLIDKATQKEVASAHITETRLDASTNAILPRRIDLHWQQEDVTLALIIDKTTVNQQTPPAAFVRQPLSGVQTFNLARGVPDGVQRAQGFVPGLK